MSMTFRILLASTFCFSVGCGAADIGEECEGAGSSDDCVDGAICTNESDKNVCRVICEDDMDCNANSESCNGVTSSNIKSCQPK